jgi:hypothetical protein
MPFVRALESKPHPLLRNFASSLSAHCSVSLLPDSSAYAIPSWSSTALGTLQLDASPIQWVSLFLENSGDESVDFVCAAFGVPDEGLTDTRLSGLRLTSVSVREFPLVGKRVGTAWKGNDRGTGLAYRLNKDRALNAYLGVLSASVEVTAHPSEGCWILTTVIGTEGSVIGDFGLLLKRVLAFSSAVNHLNTPTAEGMVGLRAIARRVLRVHPKSLIE